MGGGDYELMKGELKMGMFDKHKVRNDKFNWSLPNSAVFDLDKIHFRANADVLFVCLLLSLEKEYEENTPKTMTIKDISERIPKGTGGIFIRSSYNYAMIALFGGQKGRDYFLFEDSKMRRDLFTKQANNRLRNNNFWKRHKNERVTINPKYIP